MTLVGRLTTFFLGVLAVVLIGFSVSLYLLARTYLYRQVDDRLETALHTLVAAAEVKPDEVEWEPKERRFSLGLEAGDDQVRWTIHDVNGRIVDRSRNPGTESLLEDPGPVASEGETVHLVYRNGQPWRLRQQRLQAVRPSTQAAARGKERKHAALILTTGVSLQPLQATLQNLALVLSVLSLGLWLVAALLGRWLCRRALVPMTRMAAAARAMSAANLGQRLPGPGTRDELEELCQAFNGLLFRLQEAFERQRRFTGDASHQLRTPLTAVLGQVEVALNRDRPAEDYQHTLRLVHRQAVQLRQIVESLLFLSRADTEACLPNLESVDLADWTHTYLQGWASHSRRADLQVECSTASALGVRVHAPLMGQMLGNLLDNACKYSEPGTPIILRLGRESGMVTLTVEDTGCGVVAEDLPHLFEPFYRSPDVRRLGRVGVGLGLAVAHRIASAFGGTIRAESEPGRGSRFTLLLPEQTGPLPLAEPAASVLDHSSALY